MTQILITRLKAPPFTHSSEGISVVWLRRAVAEVGILQENNSLVHLVEVEKLEKLGSAALSEMNWFAPLFLF